MPGLYALANEMVPQTVRGRLSLRKTWERHRSFAGRRDRTISLRHLEDRRAGHTGTVCLTLLSYNTYLMRGELPIVEFLVRDLPAELLDDIPVVGEGLADLASLSGRAIQQAVRAAVGGDKIVIERKPALYARADELGRLLARGTVGNVFALSEIWNDDILGRIVKRIGEAGRRVSVVQGPKRAGRWCSMGSGLCVLGMGPRIEKVDTHAFTHIGNKRMDSDAWARKAVMCTRIDVGVGKIDLYTTHLHSGGGLPEIGYRGVYLTREPSGQSKRHVRAAQCREIVDFIKRTHDGKNVAILTGDFNINAHDNPSFRELRNTMAQVNLRDLWWDQYGPSAEGMTNGDFDTNCLRSPDNPMACNEAMPLPKDHGGNRIDYIFVEEPSDNHTFHLDLSAVRRKPFERPRVTEDEKYLSDHIGLEVRLICSPK